MGLFLSSARSPRRIALFDIGSASIAGAIVSFSESEPPLIEYATRIPVPIQESVHGAGLVSKTSQLLEHVAAETVAHAGAAGILGKRGGIEAVLCVVASSWCMTQTVKEVSEKKEPFEVSEAVMQTLFENVREKVPLAPARVVIEEVVLSSRLNGYLTEQPLRKKARSIELVILRTDIDAEIHAQFMAALETTFGNLPIAFHSFALSSFAAVRQMPPQRDDFLIIDVTGEISDLFVIRKGVLSETISFPYGKNGLVRDVARATGSVPEEALSRIKLLLSDASSERAPLAAAEQKWANDFGKACSELAESGPLPHVAYLIVDGEFFDWFSTLISRVDFSQFTTTRSEFSVMRLDGGKEGPRVSFATGALRDDFLVSDTFFYTTRYARG